jgi:hypothetical protein
MSVMLHGSSVASVASIAAMSIHVELNERARVGAVELAEFGKVRGVRGTLIISKCRQLQVLYQSPVLVHQELQYGHKMVMNYT